jgi:hypothetical protein
VNELIFVAILAAAFGTGFVLRYLGMAWFVAWLIASLVIPTFLYVSELAHPTGWFSVAALFGGIYGFALGGAGVFAAWVIRRQWHEAKQPND